MSLRSRFLLALGLGSVLFLLAVTSLVFFRMQAEMVNQLEQQFHADANNRVHSFNQSLEEITESFQSASKLPMFRSMRFNKLTLNQAAFKNDVRQLELHFYDLLERNSKLSQVLYVNYKGEDVFRVERTGIKTNLSDRSQDKSIQRMLKLKNNEFMIEQRNTDNNSKSLIWWVPVYVSSNKLEGVLGFSVKFESILDLVSHLAVSGSEMICLTNADGYVLFKNNSKVNCKSKDDSLWIVRDNIKLPGILWVLSLSEHPDSFLVEVKKIALVVFGVIFPALSILAFILANIFSNGIIRSIRKLVNSARVMGRGEELAIINIDRDDELGDLAKEMNRSARLIDSNRKELEKRNIDTEEKGRRNLQAILDHSPAIIYVKDMDGRYTFINQRFMDLFHVKREEVLNSTDHEVFSNNLADEFKCNDQAVIKAGHLLETEEKVKLEGGMHSYISMRFPLLDEKNNMYAICGLSTDITEYKQQEEKLRRSQKMDALGKLTGGIAHDYNNMLGIMLGYTELIINNVGDDPKLNKYAHEIYRAGERSSKLTKKLLAFSRKKESEAERLNINEIIKNDRHMLEKTLTARIKLVFDFADDLWDVYLDTNDLEDAILNMSINAMHAMEEGGQLTFRTRNEALNEQDAKVLNVDPGDYVLLRVVDTGCGIDPSMLDKIFDPFFSSKGAKGTGLGLSQVYGFVENGCGIIKVYSESEKGTSFTLYFPKYTENETKEVTGQKGREENLTGTESVLVVDDEVALIDLSLEILSQHGYRVFTAQSGKQALEILENETIDLMVSDVIMPEMDGYQLVALVQKKYPSMKIQLASGFSDDRHLDMVDKSLHENLIHKPFVSKELLQRIRNLLDS